MPPAYLWASMWEFAALAATLGRSNEGETVPESKTRKQAEQKKKAKAQEELSEARRESARLAPRGRDWVPFVFIPVGLLGVLWMVVYNLAASYIPFMAALGGWNVLIGLGLIVASFSLMTLWK